MMVEKKRGRGREKGDRGRDEKSGEEERRTDSRGEERRGGRGESEGWVWDVWW